MMGVSIVICAIAVFMLVKVIGCHFAVMGLVHMLIEKYGDSMDETEIKRHVDYCVRQWFRDLLGKKS